MPRGGGGAMCVVVVGLCVVVDLLSCEAASIPSIPTNQVSSREANFSIMESQHGQNAICISAGSIAPLTAVVGGAMVWQPAEVLHRVSNCHVLTWVCGFTNTWEMGN